MKSTSLLFASALILLPASSNAQTDADTGVVREAAREAAVLTTAPLTAFGAVTPAGAKYSGTPNFSVVYNATSKWYEITIKNEAYYYLSYSTQVTPMGVNSTAAYCKSDSVSGKLLVRCFNRSNAPQQFPFSFITHKY